MHPVTKSKIWDFVVVVLKLHKFDAIEKALPDSFYSHIYTVIHVW